MEVGDDAARTCVTPWKFDDVKDIIQKEKERHILALKLLPFFFFSKEKLAGTNTEGNHGKQSLDVTKLNSFKVFVFGKFPVDSTAEKNKIWNEIKGKINTMRHVSKHVKKLNGGREIWSVVNTAYPNLTGHYFLYLMCNMLFWNKTLLVRSSCVTLFR